MPETEYSSAPQKKHRLHQSAWQGVVFMGEKFLDGLEENLKIIIREKDLFLGTLFFLLGFLNFHSGKYCDGNTTDYLSCTRPVTYYYFSWLEVILIILGIFLILLWFLKRQRN